MKKGQLTIRVYQQHETIFCEVDDDGIGRTLSFQNKQAGVSLHESKAINLSQARLQLENILTESSAQIKMVDKYESERPMGTKVIISFNTQS